METGFLAVARKALVEFQDRDKTMIQLGRILILISIPYRFIYQHTLQISETI